MTTWTRVIASVIALVTWQAPASAQTGGRVSVLMQETLWCTVTPCKTTQVFMVAPDQGRLVSADVLRNVPPNSPLYVAPDGGTQVWLVPSINNVCCGTHPVFFPPDVVMRDVATGHLLRVTLAGDSRAMVGSPIALEVYLADNEGPYALSLAGARRFAAVECPAATPRSVSADGSRVAFVCFGQSVIGEEIVQVVVDTIIYDASTGAVVNRLSGGGPYPVLSDDGRTVFAARPHDRVSAATLWRADVDSGTTSSVPLPGLPADPRAFVDPRSGHLFVVAYEHFGVYDPDSLQLLRVRERYAVSPHWGLAFDRDRPWVYALDIAGVNTIRTTFSIIDTDTLATLGAGDLPSDSYPASIVVASPPRPPASLAATVVGSAVSLAWAPGGPLAATRGYVLEAGSAPGQRDIIGGLRIGAAPSFETNAVPPGRYYVRVRAENVTGLSTPSNEVVVQVP